MKLQTTLRGKNYAFRGLYNLMARANEPKAGDRLAGLAAHTTQEHMAARMILSEVRASEFLDQPAVAASRDWVTSRILSGLDPDARRETADWTIGQLREKILESDGETVLRWGSGLTSEAIAAVARLMSNMDLVLAASKLRVATTNRTTIGLAGTFSSRLQPNHPADDTVESVARTMTRDILREGRLTAEAGDPGIFERPLVR
ncbi:MAG: ethanolamine ammonia-lyase subunit EutB [Fibrobacteres bacterium]|jgi:ethanolamine ammonia-lyase large subunit|nr:ethanolamine ammonia-lyase subunit EutB [Fibrobacterota bacterium]